MNNYIDLSWKEFSIDVRIVNQQLKNLLSSNFDGLVCDDAAMHVMFVEEVGAEDAAVVSDYWDNLTEESLQPSESEVAREELLERIEWGKRVVLEFRVWTIGVPDEVGLQMLGSLIDVKSTLELGMLSAAAYLLATKPEDNVLDSMYDATHTVRERFVNMILYEGPTP